MTLKGVRRMVRTVFDGLTAGQFHTPAEPTLDPELKDQLDKAQIREKLKGRDALHSGWSTEPPPLEPRMGAGRWTDDMRPGERMAHDMGSKIDEPRLPLHAPPRVDPKYAREFTDAVARLPSPDREADALCGDLERRCREQKIHSEGDPDAPSKRVDNQTLPLPLPPEIDHLLDQLLHDPPDRPRDRSGNRRKRDRW